MGSIHIQTYRRGNIIKPEEKDISGTPEQPKRTVTLTIDEKTFQAFSSLARLEVCKTKGDNLDPASLNAAVAKSMASFLNRGSPMVAYYAENYLSKGLEMRFKLVDLDKELADREEEERHQSMKPIPGVSSCIHG